MVSAEVKFRILCDSIPGAVVIYRSLSGEIEEKRGLEHLFRDIYEPDEDVPEITNFYDVISEVQRERKKEMIVDQLEFLHSASLDLDLAHAGKEISVNFTGRVLDPDEDLYIAVLILKDR